jgi:acyl carrier protein
MESTGFDHHGPDHSGPSSRVALPFARMTTEEVLKALGRYKEESRESDRQTATKLGVNRLPPPGAHVRQSEVQFVAPSTFLERTIVRTWEEVLGVPGIGVLDHFLDLGGNSLKAMQIITRLQNALEHVLPLESLFNIVTVKEQAAAIEQHVAATTNGDKNTALIAELEAMSEEEAERQLAAALHQASGISGR